LNIAITVSMLIWMLGYMTAIIVTGGIVLAVQRRWFLHPDEDQSFVLPGMAAFGVGIMYLSVAIAHV